MIGFARSNGKGRSARRGLMGILGLGMFFGMGGCEKFFAETDRLFDGPGLGSRPGAGAALTAFGLAGMSGTYTDPQAGAAAQAASNLMGNVAAAQQRQSQTTVNVYENAPSYNTGALPAVGSNPGSNTLIFRQPGGFSLRNSRFGEITVATAQEMVDSNKDENVEFPREYNGLAYSFPKDSGFKLFFVTRRPMNPWETIECHIMRREANDYSEVDNVRYSGSSLEGRSFGFSIKVNDHSISSVDLKPGMYLALWKDATKGEVKPVAALDFEITDK